MPRPAKPWFWKARNAWCVDLDGKRHVLALGKEKEAREQAMDEFHRLMVSRGCRKAITPSRITVADLFDLFLENVDAKVRQGERERVTYDGYVRFLSSAADRFGATRAADLTQHQVHAWCDAPALAWGPTTRANAIVAVKAAFKWAKRLGLIRENPLTDMEKPTPRRRTEVLSPENAQAILAAAEKRFRDFLTVLWSTGCRPGELAGLEAQNVDHTQGILHVRDKIRRTTGKDTREVHAVPAVMEIIAALCQRHPEGPIFRNRLGHAWTRNAMACAMRQIRLKTGLGKAAVPYSFRHLFGTDALDKGVDIAIAAELMGHRNTKTLMERYAHLEERRDTLRNAVRTVRPEGGPGEDGAAPSGGPSRATPPA
jgi:site-specific recombinase XerD